MLQLLSQTWWNNIGYGHITLKHCRLRERKMVTLPHCDGASEQATDQNQNLLRLFYCQNRVRNIPKTHTAHIASELSTMSVSAIELHRYVACRCDLNSAYGVGNCSRTDRIITNEYMLTVYTHLWHFVVKFTAQFMVFGACKWHIHSIFVNAPARFIEIRVQKGGGKKREISSIVLFALNWKRCSRKTQ